MIILASFSQNLIFYPLNYYFNGNLIVQHHFVPRSWQLWRDLGARQEEQAD